jgi:hypothetical protein
MVYVVDSGSPAEKAGLLPGDFLLRLNNEPINQRGALAHALSRLRPDEPVPLTVVRGSQELTLAFTPQSKSIDLEGNLVVYVMGLIFLALGFATYLRVPDRTSGLHLLFASAVATALFTQLPTTPPLRALNLLCMGMIPGLALHFFLAFSGSDERLKPRWLIPTLYGPGMALALLNAVLVLLERESALLWAYSALLLAVAATFAAWLVLWRWAYTSTPSTEVRQQVMELPIGLNIVTAPFIVMLVADVFTNFRAVDPRLVVLSLIGLPVGLAYAILKRHRSWGSVA